MIGQHRMVSKSNRLHVVIFGFPLEFTGVFYRIVYF